jgi:PAS domain S-box-containing protein
MPTLKPSRMILAVGLPAALLGWGLGAALPLPGAAAVWVAGFGGGLAGWLACAGIGSGVRARRLARALTRELRDSEMRLNFAVSGSGLGVWDWDLPSNRLFYSPRWKQMLGYEAADIGDRPEDWENLIHPDEREDVVAQCNDCVAGKVDSYDVQYRMRCRDGSYSWVRDRGMVSVRDAAGKPLRMIGTLSDINGQMRALLQLRLLARLHAVLSESMAAMLRGATPEQLFQRICEVVVRQGGLKMAWIGLTDPETGDVRPVSACGGGTEYLDGIPISSCADSPYGRGATGTAIRENRPVWIQDFRTDPRTAPWQERAVQYGWGSSAAVPLSQGGRVIGALTFYAAEVGWYDPEIRQLCENLGAQISFALDKYAAEAATAGRPAN